jgi:uncharacterized OB-fold protein
MPFRTAQDDMTIDVEILCLPRKEDYKIVVMRISAQPDLYSADDSSPPALNGARCLSCGYVFFPPHRYGCEACGAPPDRIEPIALAGNGTLRSFATVHFHQGHGIEAPFTVGSIILDDGPAIRALLTCRTDEGLHPGDRVRSVLVAQGKDSEGNETFELRFEKAGA